MGPRPLPLASTYGRLTILSEKRENRKIRCRCVCGKVVAVEPGNLRNGRTMSCGCLNDERRRAADNAGHFTEKPLAARYGRLAVLRREGRVAFCRCDCGAEKVVTVKDLTQGGAKSCGCLRHDNKPNLQHGLSRTRAYISWNGMFARCYNSAVESYQYYGARGIGICERWHSFENFYADMGERPEGLSIERIDNDGNYEPGNCKWATPAEQCRNRRLRRDSRTLQVNGQ